MNVGIILVGDGKEVVLILQIEGPILQGIRFHALPFFLLSWLFDCIDLRVVIVDVILLLGS